jgi:hypothetical protein
MTHALPAPSVMMVEARTPRDKISRAISDLLGQRSIIFAAMERAETKVERDQLFADWRELTHQIERLQA